MPARGDTTWIVKEALEHGLTLVTEQGTMIQNKGIRQGHFKITFRVTDTQKAEKLLQQCNELFESKEGGNQLVLTTPEWKSDVRDETGGAFSLMLLAVEKRIMEVR